MIVPAQQQFHDAAKTARARILAAGLAHGERAKPIAIPAPVVAPVEPVPPPLAAVVETTAASKRLSDLGGRSKVFHIAKIVAKYYGVLVDDLKSTCRRAVYARPRQVVMYLARTMTPRSFSEIGRELGNRDHATTMHGFRKITRLIETDPVLAEQVAELRRQLEPAPAPVADAQESTG